MHNQTNVAVTPCALVLIQLLYSRDDNAYRQCAHTSKLWSPRSNIRLEHAERSGQMAEIKVFYF